MRWLAALGLLLLIAAGYALLAEGGCLVSHHGDVTTFRYAHWVPVSCLLAGLGLAGAAVAAGLRGQIRPVLGLGGTGVVIAGLGLMLLRDKITVSPEEFTVRMGEHGWTVRYAEIRDIDLTSEVRTQGSRSETVHLMVCHKRDGGEARFEIDELMSLGAEAKILEEARHHGIPVHD